MDIDALEAPDTPPDTVLAVASLMDIDAFEDPNAVPIEAPDAVAPALNRPIHSTRLRSYPRIGPKILIFQWGPMGLRVRGSDPDPFFGPNPQVIIGYI